MKRIINLLAALFIASYAAWASGPTADSADIKLYDISVAVDAQARKVRVRIGLDIEKYRVSSEREIIFTPVLVARDRSDSLVLEPVTIAGRNRWYHYLRDGVLDGGDSGIYRAGRKIRAAYDREFAYEPWMGQSMLEMRAETANCCDTPSRLAGPSESGNVPMAEIDVTRPSLDARFVFAPPVDAGPVIKSIEGSAFVTFVVNRTELKPDYMRNRAELAKIIESIEYVRRDSDATITHVHIKGFASPEGPYDNNIRLAKGRTETLRRYVRDLYHFSDSTVTSSYDPEDWAGLRNYVADSLNFSIGHRSEILSIIDGPLGFDNKDLAIKTQFPADYAVILNDIYPWLRHSDYKVTYAIRTYTDIAEIKRVFETDPTRLRNVDFYTLAQTYPEGSDDYCKVFETAVGVYPDDPMLNLNAANIEMRRGRLDQAQSHLLKAGNTALANYARGVLAARRGDYPEAIRRFGSARDAGMPGCDSLIERAKEIRDHSSVTYLVSPVSR